MPTTYTDQFYIIDPFSPPPAGTTMTFVNYNLTDQNNDGDFDRFNADNINGIDISASYPGDTVTINVPGVGNVTYTGVTFYLADGSRVFTPNDGQALQNGTLVSTTWVSAQGPLLVSQLGPACFTPGALIVTDRGRVPVENIRAGDRVRTRDNGYQTVRWAGRATHAAEGSYAPVLIEKGALGNRAALRVSQQHRILVSGWRAQLFLGADEALIAARHLVNGASIRIVEGGEVTYIHLLFDRHEIITANGLHSESFHPGAAIASRDRAARDELARLFPETGPDMAARIPTARQVARQHEAALITY